MWGGGRGIYALLYMYVRAMGGAASTHVYICAWGWWCAPPMPISVFVVGRRDDYVRMHQEAIRGHSPPRPPCRPQLNLPHPTYALHPMLQPGAAAPRTGRDGSSWLQAWLHWGLAGCAPSVAMLCNAHATATLRTVGQPPGRQASSTGVSGSASRGTAAAPCCTPCSSPRR